MNMFDRINEWLDRSELSWVTLLTKVLPILVPIIPAIQTKTHVISELGYDEWTGWVAAIIVEFFGYAAMYKMIQFAEHNRRYTDARNKAPLKFAVLIYVAYLAIIITFNVIPEIVMQKPAHIVWMNALFAILSVPAGALTAISAVHTERKEAMKRPRTSTPNEQPANASERQRTPNERTNSERRTNEPIPQPANDQRFSPFPNTETNERRADILAYVEQVKAQENRTPGPSEIARALGVSKGYASDVMNGKA